MSRSMGTTYDRPAGNWHIRSAELLAASNLGAAPARSTPPLPHVSAHTYKLDLGARNDPNDTTRSRGEIVVIHPCTFYRDCFSRCLELMYRTHDISSYDTVDRWIETADRRVSPPDAMVIFLHGNHASDADDFQLLEASAPSTPVIVLSDNEDAEQISQIIRNGARGYIPTSLPFNLAIEAVRFVVAGGTFVPANHFRSDRAAAPRNHVQLTDRQTMVLEALCKGMANKQIAYHLGMSEHTVKIHLRHIMQRLNARNRTEAAMLARKYLRFAGLNDSPS